MNAGRYIFNLFKVENRKLATQCGGHPEVTTSARIGFMRDNFGYWWTAPACRVMNWWFKQPDHCGKALAAEDDDMTRYVSDPEGRWFIPLLAVALLWRAFVLYCILFTVYETASAAELFGPYRADIVRVIDGDTVEVDLHLYPGAVQRVSIREHGINTPEKRTSIACEKKAGIAASMEAEKFLAGKNIVVDNVQPGKYAGRMMGNVFADGISLSEHMLATGHAIPYFGGARVPTCQ